MRVVSSSDRLSSVERKDLGAFYTPSLLTDYATAWAIESRSTTVLDPGCGDAAFLASAARRLFDLGASADAASQQVFGIDLNIDAVETAAETLAAAGVERPTLLQGNFFNFEPGAPRSPPQVDAIVGNPPYVRYQLFRDENRAAGLKAAAKAGVILPQLTSSWAPYVVHASRFLRPGGRLALVLPGELLHVGYAAAVREFLLRSFVDLTLVAFQEKVFPGALEEVVLVQGIKGNGKGTLRVRKYNALSDLATGSEDGSGLVCEPEGRWVKALHQEDSVREALEVVDRAKYLPLGEYGRVDIGVVTGANSYFVLSKEEVAQHKLPATVLLPAISKAAHVQGTRFQQLDWERMLADGAASYLFVADESVNTGAVASYVKRGVELGLPARYKCRTREPWFRVPYIRKPDLFLTYMSHVSPRLVTNDAKAAHTNTIHGVFLRDPLMAEPLSIAFLNSATLLSTEIEGRSYGGGVLKLEPGEAVKLRVPKITRKLGEALSVVGPRVDSLVREGRIDEASAVVDRIVLGKHFKLAEIEKIRAVLHTLRERRFTRGAGKR